MDKYVEGLDNYHVPDYISGTKDKIYVLVNWSIINIRMCNTRKSIDFHFNVFKSSLVSYYLEILRDYAKYNNIDSNYFSDKINLECRAVEFYEQLEKIKKQYESVDNERLNRLRNMLIKETEKYKKYIGYSNLKNFISETIDNTVLGISNLGAGNDDLIIDTFLSNMHTYIMQKFEDFFKDKLIKSAEKYKFYAGYNEFVKKRIHNKIDLYTSYAKDIDFDESKLEDFTNKFQNEIESIFDQNFAIINKLNKLKNIFNKNSDYLEVDSFHSLYAELEIIEHNFNNGDDIITTNLDVIESKLEKLLQIYKNKELLNKTYYNLITNYHNKLASMNPLDYKKIQRVNEIFGETIKMFAKLEWQDISLDTATDVFSRITFNNYDEDMSLIKNSIKSGVYIQNPDYWWGNGSFFYFKEDNGNYSMYKVFDDVTKQEISVDKIKNEYISLEDFLQNAEYIGKEEQITNELKALVLYNFKNMYIIRYEGIDLFIISRRTKGELKAISDYSIYGGDYKDKDELIRAIKNDVESRVMFYENKKRSEVEEEKVFRKF